MNRFVVLSLALVAFVASTTDALAFTKTKAKTNQLSAKDLPKFDKSTQRWQPAPTAEPGYPIYETLLRNGPVPFFTRLTNPGDYEQAVLKFQANEKCPINEAQGNMDAYFENPNDWAYQRTVEDRGGYKKNYGAPLDPKQVGLTVVWGTFITYFLGNFAYSLVSKYL
jgi:hypothetical protein